MRTKIELDDDKKISAAVKTGLGSWFHYDRDDITPGSIYFHPNYRQNFNKDNIVDKLQKDQTLNGIVFRPSSQSGFTTVSILQKNGAFNFVMANIELNKLEKSYNDYGLNLGNSIFEIIKAYRADSSKELKDIKKHMNDKLSDILLERKTELENFSKKQAQHAACFMVDY
ncbi:hypothetical protein [Legionella clemsonensis]|uniref:Uncharacterized protein n=1 Tax=Legionella clemsonensis TaxID=1867846 RepID=A0A222P477_9GAMM|nr:hypothetical protein [Legionella clemsonensis]ASQ46650.1 hypothetical protein clem_10520 [Legionella clemsonensis]